MPRRKKSKDATHGPAKGSKSPQRETLKTGVRNSTKKKPVHRDHSDRKSAALQSEFSRTYANLTEKRTSRASLRSGKTIRTEGKTKPYKK